MLILLIPFVPNLGLLLLAFVVRTFLFEPFSVPSASMEDTLLPGDYVLAAKYAYGYGRFSFPVPVGFSGRIGSGAPQYGDVVLFRGPKMPSVAFVKRVVGLPGDRVQMIGGVLNINGRPVARQLMEDFVDQQDGRTARIKRWRETLPNGVSHSMLDLEVGGALDNTIVYTVPAGAYFVMGDNRGNSQDSRAVGSFGYVPLENIIGRASLVYFSHSHEGEVRWERLFMTVR